MQWSKSVLILIFIGLLLVAFRFATGEKHLADSVTPIPATPQRTDGNPAKGWDYMRYGNYIGAGIPYNIYKLTVNKRKANNYLNREGKSEIVPYVFNTFTENDVEVVGGLNCFGCHASFINGEFVAGLGNANSDFTDQGNIKFFKRMHSFVRLRYGKKSGQYKAYLPLYRGSEYVIPYLDAPFIGVNLAFRLEEAAVSYRFPQDLSWANGQQQFEVPEKNIGSDVPPLWNVKKKNALYYNAMGRGDFTKLLMQVMVVAIEDSTEARTINNQFNDVLAWLENLEPPQYPLAIDSSLLPEGQQLYEANCSKCHGTYGDKETYPNLLVGTNVVKTDSHYARYAYDNKGFTDWLNKSWIMDATPKAWAQPEMGYVAPPLDGVWATAPYLHNGSVPDLETLLNSTSRPSYWKRSQNQQKNYDLKNVGLIYETVESPTDKYVYNTQLKGYGNYGHTFGDKLSIAERKAMIEYLKTL
jgi:mono/diheme cytochrome c family protein